MLAILLDIYSKSEEEKKVSGEEKIGNRLNRDCVQPIKRMVYVQPLPFTPKYTLCIHSMHGLKIPMKIPMIGKW